MGDFYDALKSVRAVRLVYFLTSTDFRKLNSEEKLESIIKLSQGIKEGIKKVKFHYPEITDLVSEPNNWGYSVFLSGKKNNLPDVVELFIRTTGTPDFVGSGRKFVEPVLEIYGKRLKRKISGCFDGKYVVDKKK
ncbi:MAG: hypothetical protein ISS23_03685 [Nanoarchaeota archaeon]|nr:hypothetical protein [Nanoarchaeota archaeon]